MLKALSDYARRRRDEGVYDFTQMIHEYSKYVLPEFLTNSRNSLAKRFNSILLIPSYRLLFSISGMMGALLLIFLERFKEVCSFYMLNQKSNLYRHRNHRLLQIDPILPALTVSMPDGR